MPMELVSAISCIGRCKRLQMLRYNLEGSRARHVLCSETCSEFKETTVLSYNINPARGLCHLLTIFCHFLHIIVSWNCPT